MNDLFWFEGIFSDPVAKATLILALVTVLLAMVTGVMAFAAFKTIQQNNIFRIKDLQSVSRKRALDEILTWAQGVVNILSSVPTSDSADISQMAAQLRPIHARSILSVAEAYNLYGNYPIS